MILVTLGTCPYPYPRLLEWIGILLEKNLISEAEGLFIQHGHTEVPLEIKQHSWVGLAFSLTREEMGNLIQKSELVIAHAGQGSTCELAKRSSCFVIVPRLSRYGEHVDDHQLEFANAVKPFGVISCTTLKQLEDTLLSPPKPFQGRLFEGKNLADYLIQCYSAES